MTKEQKKDMLQSIESYIQQVKSENMNTLFLLQFYNEEQRRLQNIEKFMKGIGAW